MNNTDLLYTGTLEIEIQDQRTYKSKNNGTYQLFKLLAMLLTRNSSFSSLDFPTYFQLYEYKYENSNEDEKSTFNDFIKYPNVKDHKEACLLNNFIKITGEMIEIPDTDSTSTEKNNTGSYAARFTGLLSSGMLINHDSRNNILAAIVSGDKKSILAVVNFNQDAFNSVLDGNQAYLKWTLQITNNTAQQTN